MLGKIHFILQNLNPKIPFLYYILEKMLNFTKQICRFITVKKASLLKSSILRPAVPTSSLSGPPITIKRYVHSSYTKKSFCSNYYICLIRSFVEYLSPWFFLRKIGIPVKHIIKFRRGIKRFSIPWLSYSVPTGKFKNDTKQCLVLIVDCYCFK